ncbi:MAG: T9SS type A sorting domain-containing protein [Bacteroidia bacterium]
MKKVYLFTIMNLIIAYSQAQYFQWAKKEGLWAYDYGYGTGIDNSGNLYVAGKYEENAIFSGVTLPNGGNNNHDGFVAKYDPAGNLSWVRTYGGPLGDYNHAMYCDGTGAVLVTGEIEGFNDVITFPGSTTTLTTYGDNDILLAKYDLSGTLLWAKSEGWFRSEKGLAVTSDNIGNIYLAGYFTDTTKFNGIQINGYGAEDIYIAKYDANGVFQWVKTAGSAGRDEAKSIRCDAAGNAYICGMYHNNANFSGTTLTCTTSYFDAFVAKYDPNGNLLWVKNGGGAYDDVAWSLTLDNQGKIYVTGEFNAWATFGSTSFATTGNADVFVACYDASGNLQWATKAGGSLIDRARGIGTDGTNLFITGQFGSSANFGSNTINAADSSDIFIAAMDNTGNFLWASSVGGVADSLETLGYESGNSVIGDASGNVYATGATLNGGVFGGTNLSAYARTDVFVTKINSTPAGIHENSLAGNVAIYPNPGKGIFTFDVSKYSHESVEIIIYNVMGQLVESRVYKPSVSINMDILTQPDGIYFSEIKTADRIIDKKKIIIQH